MTAPDVKALIGEVAARHGIMLRPDDPAFALVTVNHLVLQQAMADLVEKARLAAAQFDQAAERAQLRAGGLLAEEVRKAGTEIRQWLRQDLAVAVERVRLMTDQAEGARSAGVRYRWMALGAGFGLVLFALGTWAGFGMR